MKEKIKIDGVSIIEKVGNFILRLEIEKENISSNKATLAIEKIKSDDCISLLKMIIYMKTKEGIEENILPKGDDPLVEWFQRMQFKSEMIMAIEERLK